MFYCIPKNNQSYLYVATQLHLLLFLEYIYLKIRKQLNDVLTYIFAILPNDSLDKTSQEYKDRQKHFKYGFKTMSRAYKRNFDTERVQADILRSLTMVNSFLFALYTQVMFQLELVKMERPRKIQRNIYRHY